jgi:hypothetical protein
MCRKVDSIPSEMLKSKRDALLPSFGVLQGMFQSLAKSFQEVFLMVDALDECSADDRQHIIGFLTNLVDTLPNIKVFVTSRKESDIAQAFEDSKTPTIKIEAQNVAEDVSSYVRAEVKRLRQGYNGKKLHIVSDALEETIIKTLSQKAEGM